MKKIRIYSFLEVVGIIILTSIIMFYLGSMLMYKKMGGINFNKYFKDPYFIKLVKAYDDIQTSYYDDVNNSKIIDNAITGMYSSLDKYTSFLNENETKILDDSLNGQYNGIGIKILLNEDKKVIVQTVFDDSPAKEAGLMENDEITAINDTDISNIEFERINDTFKKGEEVKLTIKRGEESLTFNVTPRDLLVTSVKSDIISYNDQNIGYLRIELFNSTSYKQVRKHIEELEKKGIDSLIIDLRQNSGGYLSNCSRIAEMFLQKNKIIYRLKSKETSETYKDKTKEHRTYKIDVLIDNYSASASEVLAAALKESYGAKLIGMTSFGKGKVQERKAISSAESIKLTTAKWLTPNKNSIDNKGIKPDIEVKEEIDNYNYDNKLEDKVILKALEDITT